MKQKTKKNTKVFKCLHLDGRALLTTKKQPAEPNPPPPPPPAKSPLGFDRNNAFSPVDGADPGTTAGLAAKLPKEIGVAVDAVPTPAKPPDPVEEPKDVVVFEEPKYARVFAKAFGDPKPAPKPGITLDLELLLEGDPLVFTPNAKPGVTGAGLAVGVSAPVPPPILLLLPPPNKLVPDPAGAAVDVNPKLPPPKLLRLVLPLSPKAGAGAPADAVFSVREKPPLLVPKPANPNPVAGAAAAGAVPAPKLPKAGSSTTKWSPVRGSPTPRKRNRWREGDPQRELPRTCRSSRSLALETPRRTPVRRSLNCQRRNLLDSRSPVETS